VSHSIRPAERRDLDALVELRLENGRVHAALDPSVYRVPDATAVREHFDARLMADDDAQALLVAVVHDRVLGLAEVSLDPPPPAHQILLPVPSAHLHLVVAAHARGGLGRRLEFAAREWAGLRGVQQLIAGIQVDNRAALNFYDRRGYRTNAMICLRD
jgi:GNAT superfamily N-acetyltransferase